MTFNPAPTDTATVLTAAPDPSDPGAVVFTVKVLNARAGTPVPAVGTVTLYDGQNNVLGDPGTLTAGANGQYTFPALPTNVSFRQACKK
jgi:hypothetical protein